MHEIYPIVVFCFNRPVHLQKTLDALKLNYLSSLSDLFIYSDGPKHSNDESKVQLVRDIISNIEGFKSVNVINRESNMGLAASVISGVNEVLDKYDACIVLEDDLETSPYFLTYLNEALNYYKGNTNIFSVSGFCPPIHIPKEYKYESFLFPRINSWGWGTWKDRWVKVDWEVKGFHEFIYDKGLRSKLAEQGADLPIMLLKQQQGKIGSWAVRFNQACFNSGATNIYPVCSLVRNLGADGTGTHMRSSDKFFVKLCRNSLSSLNLSYSEIINIRFRRFYNPSLYRRFINYIKILLYIRRLL